MEITSTCTAIKIDGEECTRPTVLGSTVCAMHHENAIEGRKRGGKSNSVTRLYNNSPEDMKELWTRSMEALRATHDGELEPRIGASMASQISAMVKLYELAILQKETLEMREEMKEIRQALLRENT